MFPLIPLAICISLNFFLGLILNRFARRFEKFIHVFETGNVVIFRGKWMNERGELNSKGGRWKLRWLSIFPRTEKFYRPLDLGLDTEPEMNFPVDFFVEFLHHR